MEELNTVNIEEIKAEVKEEIEAVKTELNTLLERLDKILEDIDSVTTVEEAIEFDKTHPIRRRFEICQAKRVVSMTNREWINNLNDSELALWLITMHEDSVDDYDCEEELICGYMEPYYLTPNQETYIDYEDAIAATVQWLGDERNET